MQPLSNCYLPINSPLLGGALATPATQYGGIFKRIQFFEEYPYALSTLVIGAVGLLTAALALTFVKETLKVHHSSSSTPDQQETMSTLELLKSPGVGMVLFLNCHIMLLAFSFTAVIPVFEFTSVAKGGFGFQPYQISIFMAAGGLSQAIFLLIVFPYLQSHYSTGTVLRLCARAYPFFFFLVPCFNLIRRQGLETLFWITAPLGLTLGSGVAMSFTAIQLALNDVNPKPGTLGTLNSLALAMISGIRSFSPALFTSIFAVGVRKQILGGHLIWAIMVVIALAFTLDVQLLPKNAEGRLEKKKDVSAEEEEGLLGGEGGHDQGR